MVGLMDMKKKIEKQKRTIKRDNKMSHFVIRMWNKKHWRKAKSFSGCIENVATKKGYWFHTAGELLTYLEKNNG